MAHVPIHCYLVFTGHVREINVLSKTLELSQPRRHLQLRSMSCLSKGFHAQLRPQVHLLAIGLATIHDLFLNGAHECLLKLLLLGVPRFAHQRAVSNKPVWVFRGRATNG